MRGRHKNKSVMDSNCMTEFLNDESQLEATDGSYFLQSDLFISSPSHSLPFFKTNINDLNHKETIRSNLLPNRTYIEEVDGSQTDKWEASQSEGGQMSSRLGIGPSPSLSPVTFMKRRLMQALEYLRECTRDGDVLIQVWVPMKREGRRVLTTNNQPFSLNTNCKSLADYRGVCRNYEFAADEDSRDLVGFPSRIFFAKLPEWTPDVRFFKWEEYPRINFAQQFNVRGTLALPVFERGSATCLGVVEIITTARKVNYRSQLVKACKALEALDLSSSEILNPPKVKDCHGSYQAALAEIQVVLKFVCETHKLPLAQTWVACTQGKGGCRPANANCVCCIFLVDSACYVSSEKLQGFHEACSEHHLLRGEGVAGGALMTNKLCYATDITAFSKTEYPLSHHARIFELCAAAAIRLRSVYTGSADFILEFFLPLDCKDTDEQNQILSSLACLIQQASWSLHVITNQELAEETAFPPVRETVGPLNCKADEDDTIKCLKSVPACLGCHKVEEESNEIEFHDGSTNSGHKRNQKDCGPKVRAVEKRGMKTERIISLQVLRQYFSGSLKDAAKSIGVCLTTLKRICRQHGITRWPSRKIKKVGHSLRRLQRTIDSIPGAEGSIQLDSFYTNFPELSSQNMPMTTPFSTSNSNTQPKGSLPIPVTTTLKSSSFLCSHSSSSSFCCSAGAKELSHSTNASGCGDTLSAEKPRGVLKRASSDAELNNLVQVEKTFLVRPHSHNLSSKHPSLEDLPALPKCTRPVFHDVDAFRVKATFREEKIRFSMPLNWAFGDLQREIVRRFNVDDITKYDLKYIDGDSEWILLRCDADLDECIDIHRSSSSRTIKLLVNQKIRVKSFW